MGGRNPWPEAPAAPAPEEEKPTSHFWGSCGPYPPGGPIDFDTPLERSSIRWVPPGDRGDREHGSPRRWPAGEEIRESLAFFEKVRRVLGHRQAACQAEQKD